MAVSVGPHYQVGSDEKIAYVFSCPGREEEAQGYPAAGSTGRQLDALIRILHGWGHTEFPKRCEATITNAWPHVEYSRKLGRSEATKTEICAEGNLARLAQEIKGYETVVCFGRRAEWAVDGLLRRGLLRPG